MKIFNWVHRRFNYNKDGLVENERKSSQLQLPDDINNAFSNVFDEWKGGILSIGTFGYDPLKNEEEKEEDHNKQDQHEVENESNTEEELDEKADEEEEEEEVMNPLMDAPVPYDYKGLLIMKIDEKNGVVNEEFEFSSLNKGRTTLAELFFADPVVPDKPKKDHELVIYKKAAGEMKVKEKSKVSFAKKLIGDDARPIRKLNRLMRRMLKRKIHPADIGLTKYNLIKDTACENNNESASVLLPAQDTII